MSVWQIIETVAWWWQQLKPWLGWWALAILAFCLVWWLTAPLRHRDEVWEKELAPPGADLLNLNGWGRR